MEVNGIYMLCLFKDGDDCNGIIMLDVLLIQVYLLGVNILDMFYKLIVVDVNNFGIIIVVDIFELRVLFLEEIDVFVFNISWRFVDS